MRAPLPGWRTIISSIAVSCVGMTRSCTTGGLIAHIPAVIVQGRYDMICPPRSAWDLAQGWRMADLRMIGAAGHALSEPGISAELIGVMDSLRA